MGTYTYMLHRAGLVHLTKASEFGIFWPSIHGPLEALFNNVDEPGLFEQGLAFFPGVERLAPFDAELLYRLAPGVVEMIGWN